MMVKICGITNLEDALAAAEAGASALGFNFYSGSPRHVDPETAASIAERLPAGVWKAGVFVNAPPEEIERIRRAVGLDIIQLHGDEVPEQAPHGVRLWKALRVRDRFDPGMTAGWQAEAFLLDAHSPGVYGGSGRTFDWTAVRNTGKRIILAGGLGEDNVREAIRTARPWGVDACSRLESSPGRKDHQKMARFIRAALSETEE